MERATTNKGIPTSHLWPDSGGAKCSGRYKLGYFTGPMCENRITSHPNVMA